MPRLKTRVKYLEPSRAFTVKKFPPPDNVWECVKGEYLYKMNGPPAHNDPVYRIIIGELIAQQKGDMFVAALRLQVLNMTASPHLWPVIPGNSGKKLYALREFDEQFPMTLEVKLTRNCRHLSRNTILMRKKNDREWHWQPFKDFLPGLPNREYLKRDMGKVQQACWKLNGKDFPLMQLSVELRLEISSKSLVKTSILTLYIPTH
jgi:hypothetical protein